MRVGGGHSQVAGQLLHSSRSASLQVGTRDGRLFTYWNACEGIGQLGEDISSFVIQFKPQYGNPYFESVGSGNAKSVDGWGKHKKIKVSSSMKKTMIKTLEDAIKSKYKGSEETDVLLRNNERLSNVLSWVKRKV